MKKYVILCLLFFSAACAPAVRTNSYHEGLHAMNSETNMTEPDPSPIGIGSNPYIQGYIQGYNDGMKTAKNASTDDCLVGGFLLGIAGNVAEGYASSFIFNEYLVPSSDQAVIIITALKLVGSIAASFGSAYIAHQILDVKIPDLISEDSLYCRGFKDGYRTTYKSKRLRVSLKGSAFGCIGWLMLIQLRSMIER